MKGVRADRVLPGLVRIRSSPEFFALLIILTLEEVLTLTTNLVHIGSADFDEINGTQRKIHRDEQEDEAG